MAILDASRRLSKELSLLQVYAIASGATLSSGFFLLPGIAAREAGPAVVLSYGLAAIPLFPGIASKVELATAMPRAGGVYYFLDRSLGPLFGTIGGIGSWLALMLKVSFALVGMGAYIGLFRPDASIKTLAVLCAIAFGALNIFGAKKTGGFQVVMVALLLLCLLWFVAVGTPRVQATHFAGFFDKGGGAILSTTGLVCVGYIGLTKIASVAEEVKNPEKIIPRAAFLSLGTAIVVYIAGTWIMVGVLDPEVLYLGADGPDLTPVARTGEALGGVWGMRLMTMAGVLAFFSVANAGLLSASRYPLAMGRDHLMPRVFSKLGRFGTPTNAIVLTLVTIIVCVVGLDVLSIAKLAGAFQLMLFALNCLAVIVMRESEIPSYDPGYKSPFYPWMHIFGIIAPFAVIALMGWIPTLFTLGVIVAGSVWFRFYARDKVDRHGAIYHVFERLGRRRFDDLDSELRGILKEKGLRAEDPFVETVTGAKFIDAGVGADFEAITREASRHLAAYVSQSADTLATRFLEGTRIGATPVAKGAALPHLRMTGIDVPYMVIVRCRGGVEISTGDLIGEVTTSSTAYALFFLVSPEGDPGQHLRLLAKLASRVDLEDFGSDWLQAGGEQGLKDLLLRNERYLALTLVSGRKTGELVTKTVRDIVLPDGCLLALIRRDGESIVPGGGTILCAGDKIIIIGSERAIRECAVRYAEVPAAPG